MQLCIKQKVFSFQDRFQIFDQTGAPRYTVEGELFSWGKKLHVYDLSGREVAFIQQKVLSFLPRFFVFVEGRQLAEIVKEFTFLRPKYSVIGPDWEVDGSFWEHNYTISQNGAEIVTIQKEWLTFGDCYVLDISDPGQEIPALAVVLAIDCALAASNAAASSAST